MVNNKTKVLMFFNLGFCHIMCFLRPFLRDKSLINIVNDSAGSEKSGPSCELLVCKSSNSIFK